MEWQTDGHCELDNVDDDDFSSREVWWRSLFRLLHSYWMVPWLCVSASNAVRVCVEEEEEDGEGNRSGGGGIRKPCCTTFKCISKSNRRTTESTWLTEWDGRIGLNLNTRTLRLTRCFDHKRWRQQHEMESVECIGDRNMNERNAQTQQKKKKSEEKEKENRVRRRNSCELFIWFELNMRIDGTWNSAREWNWLTDGEF